MAFLSPAPRLAVSYTLDWVLVIILAGVGYYIGNLMPKLRPFSLTDPDISFPFTVNETVPLNLLFILSVLVPGVVIVFFIIGAAGVRALAVPSSSRSRILLRKLWELHVCLLGLASSIIIAFFTTSMMKVMLGKPRPDFLARCQPDLSRVSAFVAGGFSDQTMDGRLVFTGICSSFGSALLNDGLRSFPSGHASASAAGLVFLSLFLSGAFGIFSPGSKLFRDSASSPFFTRAHARHSKNPANTAATSTVDDAPKDLEANHQDFHDLRDDGHKENRRQDMVAVVSFGPPFWLVFVALVPTLLAIFISSSRWFDFRHHGWDIIVGFSLGTATAFFSYGFYQVHMGRLIGPWNPIHIAGVDPTAAPSSATTTGVGMWGARPAPDDDEPTAVQQPPARISATNLNRTGNGVDPAVVPSSATATGFEKQGSSSAPDHDQPAAVQQLQARTLATDLSRTDDDGVTQA